MHLEILTGEAHWIEFVVSHGYGEPAVLTHCRSTQMKLHAPYQHARKKLEKSLVVQNSTLFANKGVIFMFV